MCPLPDAEPAPSATPRTLLLRLPWRLSLRFGLLVVLPAVAISFGVALELLRLMFGGDYGASAEAHPD